MIVTVKKDTFQVVELESYGFNPDRMVYVKKVRYKDEIEFIVTGPTANGPWAPWNVDFIFVDPPVEEKEEKKSSFGLAVEFKGVKYKSVSDAVRATGLTPAIIKREGTLL